MICPKCGSENYDKSLFCNKCGSKLEIEDIDIIDNNEMKKDIVDKEKNYKEIFKDKIKFHINKRNVILLCSALVIIVCGIAAIIYLNNPI